MTIHLLSKASGNPNLDLVFDPYVEGTKPPSTGLLDDSGSDIVNRYAPIVYGSQAAATGLLTEQAGHADINTLFAAYGTARYGLPIDGGDYTSTVNNAGTTNATQLLFESNNSTWKLNDLYGVPSTIASGSIPSGATQILYSYSIVAGVSSGILNQASGWTALTATNLEIYDSQSNVGAGAPGKGNVINVTIQYRNSSGSIISTTTMQWNVSVPPIP